MGQTLKWIQIDLDSRDFNVYGLKEFEYNRLVNEPEAHN